MKTRCTQPHVWPIVGMLVLTLHLLPGTATPSDTAIDAWQAMRFGMFIHWGPVSIKGTEIGWSRGAQVPTDEYDQLYRQFNPTQFNAQDWVRVAKAAGMKYLVITSKHHDGFCLWPSQYTEYLVGNTPFQRDVLQEVTQTMSANPTPHRGWRRQPAIQCRPHARWAYRTASSRTPAGDGHLAQNIWRGRLRDAWRTV